MDDCELIEHDRLRLLAQLNADCHDGKIHERFGEGTAGGHEAVDRCAMLHGMFADYIENHPTVLMNPELYKAAVDISRAMHGLYGDIYSAVYPSDVENME